MSKEYLEYLNKLNLGDKAQSIVCNIIPEEVYIEYKKIVNLLIEYEKTKSQVWGDAYSFHHFVDKTLFNRYEIEDKNQILKKIEEFKSGEINDSFEEIKKISQILSIDYISSMELLTCLIEKIKSEEKMKDIILKISEKICILDNLRKSDEKYKIENISTNEYLEDLENILVETDIFSKISLDFNKSAIASFLQLFDSYMSVKKEIFGQLLPVSKKIVTNYNNNSGNLMDVPNYLIDNNLEQLLQDIKVKYNITMNNEDFEKINNSVNVVKELNEWAVNLIRGEELEKSLSQFDMIEKRFGETIFNSSSTIDLYYGRLKTYVLNKLLHEQRVKQIIGMMEKGDINEYGDSIQLDDKSIIL